MNGISSYGAYLSNQYNNSITNNQRTNSTKQTQASNDKDEVKLSDRAKNLLKELRQTYGNVDFMVASYSSDEEADTYLSRGTKDFSVLIDPEELEKMASDEDTKKKNLGIIDEAMGKLSDMKDKLGDKKDQVTRLGVSIDKNGTVSYFAELETLSEKQRERIEEAKENKKEEEGGYIQSSRVKRTKVTADSVDGLFDKINNVDWSKIKEEKPDPEMNRFDFSIWFYELLSYVDPALI